MTLARRAFASYQEYIDVQGTKARTKRATLLRDLPKQTATFERIFRRMARHLEPGPILCLGARTGAESLGARRAGFTGSIGIDLHPVGATVRRMDWHHLEFPDQSFANVYTNSIDHCLELERLAGEVRRVLEHNGRFFVMAKTPWGTEAQWRERAILEALYWQRPDDLAEAICRYGFEILRAWPAGKWARYVLMAR